MSKMLLNVRYWRWSSLTDRAPGPGEPVQQLVETPGRLIMARSSVH
jgi:hypothetical protein